MAKHMTIDTRKGIAHGLDCRLTFAQLATTTGYAISSIANEVKNRMCWSNRNYGCTNAVCAHFETCSKMYRNATGRKLPFKGQKRCWEMCEDFHEKKCEELGHVPYVCNGCDRQAVCPLRKRYYDAEAAQKNYSGTLSESRRKRKDAKRYTVTKTDAKCRVGRTYEEIRRVLVKGVSFDALMQDDIAKMLSHVNSAPRPSLDGKSPYEAFVSFYGERAKEFLEKLGIFRIPPEKIILDPILLGPKFKEEANRAILKKHGVI